MFILKEMAQRSAADSLRLEVEARWEILSDRAGVSDSGGISDRTRLAADTEHKG